jgi:hypothetical protein
MDDLDAQEPRICFIAILDETELTRYTLTTIEYTAEFQFFELENEKEYRLGNKETSNYLLEFPSRKSLDFIFRVRDVEGDIDVYFKK